MDKQMMDKTSFSGICKILKDNKYDICDCINGVFEVALLFFPGMICKDVAFITNVVNGATILGAMLIGCSRSVAASFLPLYRFFYKI